MKHSLSAQVGVRVLSEAILALRGVVLIPILARSLGVAGYGVVAQIWITAQVLIPFISLSVENAVVQRVAGAAGESEYRAALGNALIMTGFLGAVCVAMGFTPAGPYFARVTMGDSALQWEFAAAGMLAVCGGPFAIGLGYLQGRQRIAAASALHVCRSFTSALIMIGVALAGADLRGVIVSAVATDAAFAAAILAAVRPGLGPAGFSFREMRGLAHFSLPFAVGNALYLALNAVPRFALVNAAGLVAVAVFSAVVSLANPLLQVAGAVQYVVFPAATRQARGDGSGAAAGLIARSAAAVVCFGSFALVGLCALGPSLLAALTGSRLTAPTLDFAVLGYGMLFLGLYRVVVIYQVMSGRSRALLLPLSASACVVAIASVLLVPSGGRTGAAMAFLLGCATLLAAAAWQLRGSALAAALDSLSSLRPRAAVALAVPPLALLVSPQASTLVACMYAAAGTGIVAAVWLAFGGTRLLSDKLRPA